jgi:two-component system, OmpR family, response regulator
MESNKNILIVDDESDLCELLQTIFKSENFNIDCAYSLSEGKSKWRDQNPPVVLLDNNLPDGYGIDMIEDNKSLLDKSKVIMITASTFPSIRQRAKDVGIHYFIQKPFSLRTIRELIQQIVEN